jgi:hypothetical protein
MPRADGAARGDPSGTLCVWVRWKLIFTAQYFIQIKMAFFRPWVTGLMTHEFCIGWFND